MTVVQYGVGASTVTAIACYMVLFQWVRESCAKEFLTMLASTYC